MGKFFRSLVLVLLAFTGTVAVAAEVDYLNELNAEAESEASASANEGANSASHKNISDAKIKQKKDFEMALNNKLPSTYKLYKRLPFEQKMVVVETYLSNNKRMPVATSLMFDLYFKN